MLAAKRDHLPDARHRQARLQRPGSIIEPRMKHARVVTALVLANLILLFENRDTDAGKLLEETMSQRQPNDAAANDTKRLGDRARRRQYLLLYPGMSLEW